MQFQRFEGLPGVTYFKKGPRTARWTPADSQQGDRGEKREPPIPQSEKLCLALLTGGLLTF